MSRQSRPTVLVIDDDEASRLSLHVVLGAEFEVLTSGDGPSALALLRLYGADVVLLNLLMPGMSGLEALSDIKALYPDLQVIVVTPVGDTRIVVESVRRGAEDYLTKPWDEETLLSAVRAAAVRGRDTTHCVLLVGNDSERLAPFQVIMGIRVLAVAMALEEALVGPALKPWLIVLDGGVDPTHDATALRILAERYPGRPTIVTR